MSEKPNKSAALALFALIPLTVGGCRPAEGGASSPGTREVAPSPSASNTGLGASATTAADGEKAAWSVEDPPGSHHAVDLDLRSGTWMSLDVRPDGKALVFDLLGDLYELPIEGGEARNLSSGLAWDMQPRYAPDQKSLVFTSDRGGGDNIWILDLEDPKAEPKAVTDESFRLLNSPAWTPDGQYILARKHFTKTRSLGSGEIWMYHRSGGAGVQMTEKPNDQKDVGEPVMSPDGRYLYYSQDDTPGKFFEYNKDPHAGIYAIKRRDLLEQRTETFLGGPGGAVRPTPSPDGKWIAYVKRVRSKTVLVLHEIETGKERVVFDGLERDMQETWAIHGVYPAFDWLPDQSALVVWAQGKLWRVDAQGHGAKEIPFHVKDQRKVRKGLRAKQELPDGDYDVKLLRWVQTSPDGKQVVFAALGYLWIRDLATQKTRRLTKQEEHYEFFPAFSRDGRSIVYVSWDDAELGRVRVVPTRGGASKLVTPDPGHYVEPTFSPDGQSVVYRKVGGGGLRSRRHARDTGLWVAPVRGKQAPLRIARHGSAPHFGADSDRVYFTRYDDESRILASVDLQGREEREHAKSTWATQFAVSPDGRWLAFQERYNAYLMPFAPAGKPYEIGPDAKGLPLAKVSHDAGDFLHWSGDARRLHWSLGPELFTRELNQAFAFLEGAPETLPEAPASGENIGFRVTTDQPETKLALVDAKIVTMKGDEVIDNGVVLIEGNRIAAVGPRGSVKVPPDFQIMDMVGKTIIPGLVDVHAHGPQGQHGLTPEANWLHYAELAFGVTTVHDPSNDSHEIFAAAEMQRTGELVGPRIFSTGTILYGATTDFTAKVESLDDARGHLRRMKALGAFSVKSYNQPRREQRQQIVEAADELGMLVVPEGGSLYQHNMTMVVDGHTGIEHAIPVPAVYEDVVQLWSGTETGYTPTLVVAYGGRWGEDYWYQHTDVADHPRLTRFVPRERLEPRARRRAYLQDDDWNHIKVATAAAQLQDAGVSVQLGAHGQREGLGAHWELWMFAQGGMTPLEALRAGTLDAAAYIGLDAEIGSLEPGKMADLVIIDGDPLADIRQSEKVIYTMVNGRLYDAETMDQVAPTAEPRRRFWWELDALAP